MSFNMMPLTFYSVRVGSCEGIYEVSGVIHVDMSITVLFCRRSSAMQFLIESYIFFTVEYCKSSSFAVWDTEVLAEVG